MAWSGLLKITVLGANMKPCRSPYCECAKNQCTHPGYYDARGEHYDPSEDARELGKWLNEEPNRDINRPALARVPAYLQNYL